MVRTPSLANPPLRMMPPGTPFSAPLHGILRVSRTRYIYVYSPGVSVAVTISTKTPWCYNPAHFRILSSATSPVIGTVSFAGRRFLPGSTHGSRFDYIQLFFDSIQLTFNVFIFNSSHTIITSFQSGFRESHIGLSVFDIIQH